MAVKKYFQKFLRQIPNILTLYRIAAAVAILFMPPYETAFYVVYAMAGVSDLFDGVIARALKSDSRFGSTADTVADVLLTLTGTHVVISNMQPLDYGILSVVVVMFASRAFGAIVALIRFKKFAMLHTAANKIGLVAFFLIPFFYQMCAEVGAEGILIYTITGFCILGAIEEVFIELLIPSFDESVLSIVTVINRRKKAAATAATAAEKAAENPSETEQADKSAE